MLNYAPFTPETKYNFEIQHRYSALIREHATKNGYEELKCDCYGTDGYFYHRKTRTMYKASYVVCDWCNDIAPEFKISYDRHILQLNGLI